MNFQERLERIKRAKHIECFGTTLFLAGYTLWPDNINFNLAQIAYKKLEKLDKPETPCVVCIIAKTPKEEIKTLGEEYLHHMGILIKINPYIMLEQVGGYSVFPKLKETYLDIKKIEKLNSRVEFRKFTKK